MEENTVLELGLKYDDLVTLGDISRKFNFDFPYIKDGFKINKNYKNFGEKILDLQKIRKEFTKNNFSENFYIDLNGYFKKRNGFLYSKLPENVNSYEFDFLCFKIDTLEDMGFKCVIDNFNRVKVFGLEEKFNLGFFDNINYDFEKKLLFKDFNYETIN